MISPTDRLTQQVRSLGVRATTSFDLVTVAFSRRAEDADANPALGRRLLQRFGSIRALGEASFETIHAETGLEPFEVLRCFALMELGRRSAEAGKGDEESLDCAEDVYRRLRHLRYEKREHFVAVLLDSQNRIERIAPVHVGTLTMSLVGPREVFREAIREGASAVIVAHNHPSGDPTPSPEDLEVTRRLKEVGDLLDIPLLDHIIVGERDYKSFRKEGLL